MGTRVLSPLAAVVWAAFFNFAALFTGGVAVAKAVGGGMIEQSIVDPHVILGGAARRDHLEPDHVVLRHPVQLVARTHRRIRRLGDGEERDWRRSRGARSGSRRSSFIVISPMLGFFAGFVLMVVCYWLFKGMSAKSRVIASSGRRSC